MTLLSKYVRNSFILILVLASSGSSYAHFKTTPESPIQISKDGVLTYKTDEKGDRVPDYSFCGYMASEAVIPNVAVKVIVPCMQGDATGQIQYAINIVSAMPLDEHGFRGVVLLEKGTFRVDGSLSIRASGVVLRGSGCSTGETVLQGTGVNRETLIRVCGVSNRKMEASVPIIKTFIPVNSSILPLEKGHTFEVGDQLIVNRPSTNDWIKDIGADKIGLYVDYPLARWLAGDFDQNWFRKVVAVSPESITIDVPLTNSLDPHYGGGNVAKYTWAGRIRNCGVENLRCISSFDSTNLKDENHRWMAITMDNVTDSWVRRVVAENFVSSAVAIWETSSRITVEDCKSLSPIGEIGNFRRYSFQTLGQQVLFQRCYAEYGYHAFSVGFTTPGPNAFVQCYSYLPYNFSGAIGGWATGILFDNMTIDGGNISFGWRDVDGQGGGWSTANSLCWSSRVAQIHLGSPPGSQNWAYASWAQGYGKGHHELQHTFVNPKSIYYAQLEARTGKKSKEVEKILVYSSKETTAPSAQLSAWNSERSKTPDLIMDAWIDRMIHQYPLHSDLSGALSLDDFPMPGQAIITQKKLPIVLHDGLFVQGDRVLDGKRNRTSMWRGSTRPSDVANASANLVRFVPGRIGRGLTDDLDTLISDMQQGHVIAMQSFPALWYERRRDDHARTRRADADVWTPFYEQPFSRSGQGEAFDRLSKYDLRKWNTWYWQRLKTFSDRADENGLLLIQEHYLQHNIIEEGAHWADYPWRSANNINALDFAENPHYAGDKRVYMAEEFYDTTHLIRKKFHRDYIRKSLDNFKGNTNLIHHLGIEYTGPLQFVQFWLDVISEWEQENKMDVLVMLPGTKDVQDAILADPRRSAMVDVIDIIQWQYRSDGSLYAPGGGVSMAARQYARIMTVGESSFQQIYRAVKEYRLRYPQKAVVYSRRGAKMSNWAAFMAGGSLATLPPINDASFFKEAVGMKIIPMKNSNTSQYVLGAKDSAYIIFNESPQCNLDIVPHLNDFQLKWIKPDTGEIISGDSTGDGNLKGMVQAPFSGAVVAWLTKK